MNQIRFSKSYIDTSTISNNKSTLQWEGFVPKQDVLLNPKLRRTSGIGGNGRNIGNPNFHGIIICCYYL